MYLINTFSNLSEKCYKSEEKEKNAVAVIEMKGCLQYTYTFVNI